MIKKDVRSISQQKIKIIHPTWWINIVGIGNIIYFSSLKAIYQNNKFAYIVTKEMERNFHPLRIPKALFSQFLKWKSSFIF